MTFKDFLFSLQGGLIEAGVGVILSWIADYWPAYKKLDAIKKRLVMGIFCLGLPLLASLVSAAMGYQSWSFEITFWPAIYAGGVVFMASQGAHLRQLGKTAADDGD